jgi:hypothetical protein
MSIFDDMHSEVSESELSDALNTSVFDTHTLASIGKLPDVETGSDLVEINGKPYIPVNHTANQRAGCKPSWIWDHGRELQLLSGQNPQKCWQCSYCGQRSQHAGRKAWPGRPVRLADTFGRPV